MRKPISEMSDEELKALPVFSGGDEPAKEKEDEEAPDPATQELEKVKAELEAVKAKTSEYEKMVLSDDYLMFLASQRQQEPEPEPQISEDDLENMSKKDLVELILTNVQHMVRQEVTPIKHEVAQDKYTEQVQNALAKYEDYLDFKDEMIRIATEHPSLNAEQVYKLAGGTGKLRSKETPPSPPGGQPPAQRRPVRAAIPAVSGPVSKKFVPIKTVEAASKAYDNIFGKEE